MRVVRIANVEHIPLGPAAAVPGWTGGEVHRTRQPIIPEGESDFFNASIVNFQTGAQTGWHRHSSDQILVITTGNGTVADETHEVEVGVGDVVQIKAGENHWHGATANGYMGHITITASDSTASR
jgi:quercetin dioxygenase-like cupin family protein